jgi:hypothetical protein
MARFQYKVTKGARAKPTFLEVASGKSKQAVLHDRHCHAIPIWFFG